MTLFGEYIKFLTCLAVGLAGISFCMKCVIEHFFTDRSPSDYEWTGRMTTPAWGPRHRFGDPQAGLVATIMKLLVRIPPQRRVAELQQQKAYGRY